MKVEYVSKDKLYPAFGIAYQSKQIAWVRNDLPESVKKFVKEHEVYHLTDPVKWWLWREIRANFHAALKHPIGFIYCTILSLSWGRLKFYYNRFRKGQ